MCVIIYGGGGWIGQQFQKELTRRKIPFHLAEARVGKVTDEEVGGNKFIAQNGYKFTLALIINL
jgi:hypothetical protein